MQPVRRDGSPHVVASPRLGRGSDSSIATASWSGTSTRTSMSGIECHAALCLATPYHGACYRSVNRGDHPGEQFQSGSVDHSSNVRRDRRPRQHRVRGGGVPGLSHGRRERRTSGGQRGWPGPAEPTVTPRWDGRARQASPLGSGTPGAVRMGWSGPRRTGAGYVTGPGSWGPESMGGSAARRVSRARRGCGGARGAGRSPTPAS